MVDNVKTVGLLALLATGEFFVTLVVSGTFYLLGHDQKLSLNSILVTEMISLFYHCYNLFYCLILCCYSKCLTNSIRWALPSCLYGRLTRGLNNNTVHVLPTNNLMISHFEMLRCQWKRPDMPAVTTDRERFRWRVFQAGCSNQQRSSLSTLTGSISFN